MKAHFIGLCGVGMSGAAELLREAGWEVTGSDEAFYPPASAHLEERGFSFARRYAPENIPPDADMIVVGKHAKLVPEENGEVRAALASGITVRSFPEVLGELARGRRAVVVAGNHGKSTSAALLAWCLICAGRDPGYFIGAFPYGFTSHAKAGGDKLFIIEGDEYPSANWDPTSKFLHYGAGDLLLTGVEHDHVNVFPTAEAYRKPFRTLIERLPKDGLISACTESADVKGLVEAPPCAVERYALRGEAEWGAEDIRYGKTTTFTLTKNGKPAARLATTLLGSHNIANIVGVSALLLGKNMLTPDELSDGVASFRGLKRRLDLKTHKSPVLVYEGFGTSVSKARSAIEAMRLHFPDKRLFVVFEPHTFSWRNRGTIHWYDGVFEGAERVVIYKPPGHGASSHEQLGLEEIVDYVLKNGVRAIGATKPGKVLAILEYELGENDIVLILTSGDLDGLAEAIPRFAEEQFKMV